MIFHWRESGELDDKRGLCGVGILDFLDGRRVLWWDRRSIFSDYSTKIICLWT